MSLASRRGTAYSMRVPAKSGAGFDSLKSARRIAPDRAFFYALSHHLNGGLCGEAERLAGVLTDRSVNPAFVRHHLFDSSVDGLQSARSPL